MAGWYWRHSKSPLHVMDVMVCEMKRYIVVETVVVGDFSRWSESDVSSAVFLSLGSSL